MPLPQRILLLSVTFAAVIGCAQTPAPIGRLPEWGRIRTAAAPILGLRVGLSASTFPQLTLAELAAKAGASGLLWIAASSEQRVSLEIPKKFDHRLAPGEVTYVKDMLRAANVRMPVYQVNAIGPDEAATRKIFEFAKSLGVETISAMAEPAEPTLVGRLSSEYGISVGRPGDNRASSNAPRVSTAVLTEHLRKICSQEPKPSLLSVEPASVEELERALQPLMAERVAQIARTSAIRGPDRLPPEDRKKIEAALPDAAAAAPKKPRRLLVIDLNAGYPGHRSIPHANLTLELLGKKTGAFETMFSNDLDNLKHDKIRQFDAVYLNNTVGMILVDPEVRESLMRFIREGGGLGGNHATSHASMDWTEFGDMLGARGGTHRDPTERATVKIDDPASPLTAAFSGRPFVHEDEFFRFAPGPFSREKLRVLLSMDIERTDLN
ncbi:MAG: ThuA domain-containing protein, partial [Bryobacteraceae bacterium]